jgi:hypothetical protein
VTTLPVESVDSYVRIEHLARIVQMLLIVAVSHKTTVAPGENQHASPVLG